MKRGAWGERVKGYGGGEKGAGKEETGREGRQGEG